jgi:hypothetical protein
MTKEARQPPCNPGVQQLLELLIDTLNTERAIKEYLYHRNPSFEGAMPIILVKRREFDRVVADLLALREGVYV